MADNRPYVLSLAGFDPSGGAGLLADCKVFEQFRCVGLAACTAVTVQTEDRFYDVRWLGVDEIRQQLDALLKRYPIQAVKIGIVENLTMLDALVDTIRAIYPSVFVVWDPVVAASSGFDLLGGLDSGRLAQCLMYVDVITPNIPEAQALFGTMSADELQGQRLSTAVYLKGGHAAMEEKGMDYLVSRDGEVKRIPPFGQVRYGKHGSGCILSAGIAANIALGLPLLEACKRAKQYTERVLDSNPTGLAYHRD